MTLHLSVVRRGVAVQVSDRHLTRPVPGTPVYDYYANKNIVFASRYGLVTLGYTGRAYLENVPSDEWIARRLWQDDISGRGTIVFRNRQGKWPDIGQAVEMLCRELDRAFSAMRLRDEYFAVVIAGWQWTRRSPRLRGVLWYLSNEGPSGFWVSRQPRFSATDRIINVAETPSGYMPLGEYRQMEQAIAAAVTPDETEQILTAKVAQVATRTNAVGPDSLVIRIVPSQTPHVRFRFRQATPPRAAIRYRGRDTSLAYSPWVVTRDCLWRPAVVTGGKTATSHGGIDIEAAGPDDANYAGFFPQRRTGERGPSRRVPLDWPPPPPPDAHNE